ncbi:MAG: tetratricopeptide repeat protein, partial [Chloroflexales bacterium]|nr:tetratricopeptide repeat protein [Chloroflexales bacterium]
MAMVTLKSTHDYARRMLEERHTEQAIALVHHVLEFFPDNLDAHYILGTAYLASDQFEQARFAFQRVLDADPENVAARNNLSLMYEREGKLEDAVRELEQALDIHLNKVELRARLQQLYTKIGSSAAQREYFSQAGLARLYAKGYLFDQAIQEFRSIVEERPDRIDARIGLAETLWRDGQADAALVECRTILAENSLVLKANLILGYAQLTAGDSEGEQYWQIAQRFDPYQTIAYALFNSVPSTVVPQVTLPAGDWIIYEQDFLYATQQPHTLNGRTVSELAAIAQEAIRLVPEEEVIPATFMAVTELEGEKPPIVPEENALSVAPDGDATPVVSEHRAPPIGSEEEVTALMPEEEAIPATFMAVTELVEESPVVPEGNALSVTPDGGVTPVVSENIGSEEEMTALGSTADAAAVELEDAAPPVGLEADGTVVELEGAAAVELEDAAAVELEGELRLSDETDAMIAFLSELGLTPAEIIRLEEVARLEAVSPAALNVLTPSTMEQDTATMADPETTSEDTIDKADVLPTADASHLPFELGSVDSDEIELSDEIDFEEIEQNKEDSASFDLEQNTVDDASELKLSLAATVSERTVNTSDASLRQLMQLGQRQGFVDLKDIIDIEQDFKARIARIIAISWLLRQAGIEIRNGDSVVDTTTSTITVNPPSAVVSLDASKQAATLHKAGKHPSFGLDELGLTEEAIARLAATGANSLGNVAKTAQTPDQPMPTATPTEPQEAASESLYGSDIVGLMSQIPSVETSVDRGELPNIVKPSPMSPPAREPSKPPTVKPFSLEDLGLSPSEIAALEAFPDVWSGISDQAEQVSSAEQVEQMPIAGAIDIEAPAASSDIMAPSLEELGLDSDEIAALAGKASEPPTDAAAGEAPFSLADLGLDPDEIAALTGE